MEVVSGAQRSVELAQAILDRTNSALANGHVSIDTISAQQIAETQAEVQVEVLKEAIAAENLEATALIDLLA